MKAEEKMRKLEALVDAFLIHKHAEDVLCEAILQRCIDEEEAKKKSE